MKTIDIHIHGICGFDTRTTNEQDILKLAEIQASAGVSEIIPTIYPDTVEVMRENILAVKEAMEIQKQEVRSQNTEVRSKKQEARMYAHIRGVNLEGPFLNPQKCGALNAASFMEPTEYNIRKLLDGFEDIVRIITIAPEIAGALKLIKQASDMGIVVSMGHSDATYTEAETGFNSGAKGITHLFNAMSGFHHREPGLAGFGLLNKEIFTEVIADPYHLHSKTLELIFRTKNPEKIILVSDTVKASGASAGFTDESLMSLGLTKGDENGIILRQAQDDNHGVMEPCHGELVEPLLHHDRQLGAFSAETGRLLGGSMTIVEASNRLIDAGYDKAIVTECMTTNPAMYLLLS